MTDLFGFAEGRPEFRDIRNQRESVAAEKARLCGELNDLLRKTPRPSAIGSIQLVRAYKAAHKSALKILSCKTSSRQELESQINAMKTWHAQEAA